MLNSGVITTCLWMPRSFDTSHTFHTQQERTIRFIRIRAIPSHTIGMYSHTIHTTSTTTQMTTTHKRLLALAQQKPGQVALQQTVGQHWRCRIVASSRRRIFVHDEHHFDACRMCSYDSMRQFISHARRRIVRRSSQQQGYE